MTAMQVSLQTIENAIREVCIALDEKSHQPPSWAEMTEYDLWRELVACILGSRVRFETAYSAVERLEKMGLLREVHRSLNLDQYERDVLETLAGNSYNENGINLKSRYPFFRTRANQVRGAAEQLYGKYGSIQSFLYEASDVRETRRCLASEVPGLGPKQASLFLRNIGYSADIAVLDVHVLTYMNWVGLTDTPVKSISTVRKYETLENAFIWHSYALGYTPECFDLAVWVVVKVVKAEGKTWE